MFLCVGGVGNQKWQECEVPGEGNSMMPLLRNGKDEVVVGPYDKEELKLLMSFCSGRQTGMYCIGLFKKRQSLSDAGDGVCRFMRNVRTRISSGW